MRNERFKIYWRYPNKCCDIECTIVDLNNNKEYKGSSHCSKSDNFNKNYGRKISFQRACSQLSRNDKKVVYPLVIQSSPKTIKSRL